MATLHGAELRPTKIQLLSTWVPTQPWARDVDASVLESVGAYRFDDPAGEVGVETHLLRAADGQILQVPLTYRAQALEGADHSLITTMHHSVLGKRWVYDASVDPVFARTLAATILRGGQQAELIYLEKDGPHKHDATTLVRGSGSPGDVVPVVEDIVISHDRKKTVIDTGDLLLRVLRVVGVEHDNGGTDRETLLGRWPGHDQWTLLSTASRTAH